MSNIYTIPKYLPKALKDYVAPIIKYDEAQKKIYPFERFISYPAMQEVWQTLEELSTGTKTKCSNPQILINFLTYVNGHSSLYGKTDSYITEPSDIVQHDAYCSIQKSLESVIKSLKTLSEAKESQQGSIENGWQMLERAISRCEVSTFKSKEIPQPKQLAQLTFDLNRINEHLNISDILESMTFAAMAASHAKDNNLPKRRNTPKAKTNKFIKDLSDYFMSNFNQPLDDLVAISTNVAFDFSDERVTQDTVRKLRNPRKPKSKSKKSK